MQFSNFAHLERWEGLRLKAYRDVGGIWTIGYGHTGPDVYAGKTITVEQAADLALVDIEEASDAVNRGVKVPITQNQFDALVSLTYNIGVGAFARSTCLRRLNQRDFDGAAEALTWWNKVKGRVVDGLVNRRNAEKELFLTPDKPIDKPTDTETKFKALVEEFIEKLKELL